MLALMPKYVLDIIRTKIDTIPSSLNTQKMHIKFQHIFNPLKITHLHIIEFMQTF